MARPPQIGGHHQRVLHDLGRCALRDQLAVIQHHDRLGSVDKGDNDVDTRFQCGVVASEALHDLRKAESLKPKHPAVHDYLSETYSHLGDEERAQEEKDIADELRDEKE